MSNKSFIQQVKEHKQLYLFLLLPLAYIIIFAYIPMAGVQLAFKDFMPKLGIWGSPWIGFDNFERFFDSYYFGRVLKNTLTLSIYGLIAGFPIPIIFALLLNAMRNQKYKKIIQTTTYIPHFISTVVMVGMVMQVLNPRIGLFGLVANFFGVENPVNLIAIPDAFADIYVWSGIWQTMGWSTIIYIAALSSSDTELHEAMLVDGATRFQRIIHLDFPCILPTATILLILNSGAIMNVGFEKAFLLQNELNMVASEVISTHVYKVGLTGMSDFSYATAIGLFNSIINFTLLVIVNAFAKKTGNTSLF